MKYIIEKKELINLKFRIADLKNILPYEQMLKREFYCEGDRKLTEKKIPKIPDRVHLKDVYFVKILELMFFELGELLKKQSRADKRSIKLSRASLNKIRKFPFTKDLNLKLKI